MNTSYKRIQESNDRLREEAILDINEKTGCYNSITNKPYRITINSESNKTTIEIKLKNKVLLKEESLENLLATLNAISDDDMIEALTNQTYTLPFASGKIKSLIGNLESISKLIKSDNR